MLELDIIKSHVRPEPDETEEDALLETYANTARSLVENKTGRTLYATETEIPKDAEGSFGDAHALVLDDDLTTAMLIAIQSLYDFGLIKPDAETTIDALVKPYQHFNV